MRRLVLAALLTLAPAAAPAGPYEDAAGNVVAATWIWNGCKGIAGIGPAGDQHGFTMAAKELLVSQGYGEFRIGKLLFYGRTEALDALGRAALAARGVDPANTAALCAFGRQVAGKRDAIGQFLVRN